MNKGEVAFVGAGPGDVKLITVRGQELLRAADVVLYDRLVHPLLLEETQPEAERIYCGKLPDRHHLRQETIQEILIEKAQQGKRVVRLKGGDPGVFGRVGEETSALDEASISYEVVPGITSGIAAATYAGVPVTHRDYSTSFTVVTGHSKEAAGVPAPDWADLAAGSETIAFYMGVKNLPTISRELLSHGKPADTPVLIIEWGTTGRQRTVEGTLATIVDTATTASVQNPAITLVGEVCSLRNGTSWYEEKLHLGRVICFVPSRDSARTEELLRPLQEEGAEVLSFPQEVAAPLPVPSGFWDQVYAASSLSFLEKESVVRFFDEMRAAGLDVRSLPGRISVPVGAEGVSDALYARGITNIENSKERFRLDEVVVGSEAIETAAVFWRSHEWRPDTRGRNTLDRLVREEWLNTVIVESPEGAYRLKEEVETLLGQSLAVFLADKDVLALTEEAADVLAEEGGYAVLGTSAEISGQLHSMAKVREKAMVSV
ncbi:uroporphyrinogen-III C-methyltransferase [Salsuginibacillus kocurii]|uniref:uroporphyrinogen-III C-methyltransferase n=1 Tax=Salsuginibacillus kocurii TaxID=427078 RepID=UPI0003636710|nr:uroporphyrinogen-III C-methyltransferase [Salsuginibacillus kocurii]